MTIIRQNTADGGTDGGTVTAANSAGGSGTAWDLVSIPTGALTFSAAQAQQGALSYAVTTTASSAGEGLLRWGDSLGLTAASSRVFVYLPAANPTVNTSLVRFSTNNAGTVANACTLTLNTIGKLLVQDSAGAVLFTSASALPKSTWVRLELYCQPGTSTTGVIGAGYATGTGALAEQYTSSTANIGSGPIGRWQIGKLAGTWATQTFYLDNAALADTAAFIGTASANNPPTAAASASPSANVEPGATVTLTGTDSDSDGTVATRAWTQTGGSSAGTITGASAASATVTAPGTLAGSTLTFTYTVTDSGGATASATASFSVLPSTERAVIGGAEVPLQLRDAVNL